MNLTVTPLTALLLTPLASLPAAEPKTGESRRIDTGEGVTPEVVDLPPGEFMMDSPPEDKNWVTGIEESAPPGTTRESSEGEQSQVRLLVQSVTLCENPFWTTSHSDGFQPHLTAHPCHVHV